MGRICKYCKQGVSESRTLHRFPLEDASLLEIWRERLNFPPSFIPTQHSRICSDHFPRECFKFIKKRAILIEGSIPEFFSIMKHCCFYCKATKDTKPGISLRKFPLNKPDILEKWLLAINMENFVPDKDSLICSDHFQKSCFKEIKSRKRLNMKEDAIPSIFKVSQKPEHVSNEPLEEPAPNLADDPHFNVCVDFQNTIIKAEEGYECETVTSERCNFDTEMIPELTKLCRTCLAPDKDLISIYEEEESNNDSFRCIADIIGNLTNIMPNKLDGLPDLVCLPCSNEIKNIHYFKLKCINSECILRKILEKTVHEEMMLDNNAVVKTDKDPDQMWGEENIHRISSGNSDFIIIKSENPSCSFDEGDMLDENIEKQGIISVHQADDKSQPMEVIVKEEPIFSVCSDQSYEPEMESELSRHSNDENQIQPNFCEQNSQNHMPEVEPELGEANTNDKGDKSKLKCPNCHKLFMHLARLKRHIKSQKCVDHNNPSKEKLLFTCSICGKKYNRQFSLQRHSLISHKHILTKEIINEMKKDKINLVENQDKNELNGIEAMRQCNRCKDVFENDDALAQHMVLARHTKSHQMEKTHICSICKKAFSFSHNLRIHYMNHKKIKPFKCEQCNLRFVRNSCLTRHLKTHSDERPFTCEFCQKGFPYLYALKTHERSHTEERPYSCTICSMRFKFPYTLKEHQRTHTGEKPFPCKLCPRKLSSKTNFRIHMKTHEKDLGISVEKLITDPVKLNVEKSNFKQEQFSNSHESNFEISVQQSITDLDKLKVEK